MPRATGPIGYIEHRSPRKDENGKYIIHPQFVQKEMYDAEKMAHDSQGRCMTNGAQFVSVMDTIETLTLQALSRGDAVRIGDICTIRPKLRVRHHKDENGEEYKKTYHEGELIPANEVEVCGFDIQPTKEFMDEFDRHHYGECSRQMWSLKMPASSQDKEESYVLKVCEEQGYITVKDFVSHFGVTKYHARKVLEGYCEMPAGWLRAIKEGPMVLYTISFMDIILVILESAFLANTKYFAENLLIIC